MLTERMSEMGRQATFRCVQCGYSAPSVFIGGGRMTPPDLRQWPIVCSDCRGVLSADWDATTCPTCESKRIERLGRTSGAPAAHTAWDRALDSVERCPRCGENALSVGRGIFFD